MTTFLNGWAGFWVWLGLTVTLTTLMQVLPVRDAPPPRRIPHPWLRRLLRGEMAIGGSVRIGLGAAAALWWAIAAGLLVSDVMRAALALAAGGGVLTALVNAGRRAHLSVAQATCLCAALSVGGVLLLMVSAWLGQRLYG